MDRRISLRPAVRAGADHRGEHRTRRCRPGGASRAESVHRDLVLASRSRQPLAVPAAGRRGLCLDGRHQREYLERAVHRGSRGQAFGIRHRSLRRPRGGRQQHDVQHRRRQRDPRQRRQGDLLRERRHVRAVAPRCRLLPRIDQGSGGRWLKDEKWVDIRQTSILLPIMNARVAKCKQAGFDGVEWDTVDGYTNRTGFPLTASDQLFYNASLANLAHSYGLTVALKNDVEQLPDLGRTSTTRSTSSASSTASATATRRTSSARGRPSSRSSTSSGSRSSARKRTPRTGTRSSRRTTCSTRPGPLVDRSGISVGS